MRKSFALIAMILLLSLPATMMEAEPFELKLSKLESVFYRLLPDGTISDGEAEITIRVENPSEQEKAITIVDRVYKAHLESFNVLSGSPEPSSKEVFFDHLVCIWKDLVIPPSSDLELRYSVSTFKLPPIRANISYYVNGKRAQIVELEGDYYIMINSGDILTINLTMENLRDPLYINGEVMTPPISYSIEMRVPKNNFLEPESHPEPYMVYSLSDDWSITWIGVLEEEPINLSILAKARGTEFVGEVELKAIRIQLKLDVSSMADQLEEMLESYNASLNELKEMRQGLLDMQKLMKGFSRGIASSIESLSKAQVELLRLSESLRNASSSVERARYPLKNVISILERLESNLTGMMDVVEEIQTLMGNVSFPNITLPIELPGQTIMEELYSVISRIKKARSSLYAADRAFETMQISLAEAADYAYNSSVALGELQHSLNSIGIITNASLRMIEATIEEMDSKISEISSNMDDLSKKIRLMRFKEPFLGYVEVRNSSCSDFKIKAGLSEITSGKWAITSLVLEGQSINASEVAIQILSEFEGIATTPPTEAISVQIYDGENWMDINGTVIGVIYDEELGALLYKPGKPLVNGSNYLVDQMNNRFRVVISSSSVPDVICQIDPICGISVVPKVRMITKVDNPYLAFNMNLTEEYVEETPPPEIEAPPEGKGASYLVLILGFFAIIAPLAVLLKVKMDREMRMQLYVAIEELEKELERLKSRIKEKKISG